VNSVDVTAGAHGLAIAKVATATTINGSSYGFQISYGSVTDTATLVKNSAGVFQHAQLANTFYYSGTAATFTAGTTISFNYGTAVLVLSIGSAGATTTTFTSSQTFVDGEVLSFTLSTSATQDAAGITGANILAYGTGNIYSTTKLNGVTGQFILNPTLPASTNILLTKLQADLLTLRSRAQAVGSNVALLNTRLDFTNNYVNLLTQGGGKLTLADLNEEGANLLSLQTRQQLGIQALSFAGQNERAVLSLFR
jgi:flagellin